MEPEYPEMNIVFGLETDISRVLSTLKNFAWFRKNSYSIALPAGVDEHTLEPDVSKLVSREYEAGMYRRYVDMLYDIWSYLQPRIRNLRKHVPFSFRDRYTVYITRYGAGCSYDARRGAILINISNKTPAAASGTLIHEMVHIALESLMRKYKVDHWRKERLVDLICEKYFADIRKQQRIPEDVSIVDRRFKAWYPNLDRIARSIGTAKAA